MKSKLAFIVLCFCLHTCFAQDIYKLGTSFTYYPNISNDRTVKSDPLQYATGASVFLEYYPYKFFHFGIGPEYAQRNSKKLYHYNYGWQYLQGDWRQESLTRKRHVLGLSLNLRFLPYNSVKWNVFLGVNPKINFQFKEVDRIHYSNENGDRKTIYEVRKYDKPMLTAFTPTFGFNVGSDVKFDKHVLRLQFYYDLNMTIVEGFIFPDTDWSSNFGFGVSYVIQYVKF